MTSHKNKLDVESERRRNLIGQVENLVGEIKQYNASAQQPISVGISSDECAQLISANQVLYFVMYL